jgi:hypothetical protein
VSGTTDLLCFYYRLHVSTYIQVIFRPFFNKRVRNCYAWWNPTVLIKIKYLMLHSWWTLFSFSFPFCRIVVCAVSHKLISPCIALAFHTICWHFYFSVGRPGMGGIEFPSICFLFICGRAEGLSHERCVGWSAIADALCSSRICRSLSKGDQQLWLAVWC